MFHTRLEREKKKKDPFVSINNHKYSTSAFSLTNAVIKRYIKRAGISHLNLNSRDRNRLILAV